MDRQASQDQITVSVILPVYNVAPWLGDCIESLKAQTQPGLEFIFVDDCSTDGSLAILEAFARKDPRVRILRNETNSGSGFTRNRGIEAARGEYLSFVDPDDLPGKNFYKQLYAEALRSGCDMVKGIRIPFEDGRRPEEGSAPPTVYRLNRRIALRAEFHRPLYTVFTYEHQSALFKASLFRDPQARYGTSRVAQDVIFLLKVCYNSESVALLDGPAYHYRLRSGAATSDYSLKRAMAQTASLEEGVMYLKEKDGFPDQNHIRYIRQRLKSALAVYYYATEEVPASPAQQEEFGKHIQNIVRLVGDSVLLSQHFPELDVYLTYGKLIPAKEKRGEKLFTRDVEEWNDFFKEHPHPKNKEYHKRYATILVRAVNDLRKTEGEGLSGGRAFMKTQMAPLSPGDKRRVLLRLPSCLFKALQEKAEKRKLGI